LIRFLLVVALVLGVAYTAGDLYARSYADHQLEQRVRAVVPGAQGVSVTISSFPFLAPLLASGDVRRVSAHAGRVTEGRVTFDRIDVALRDVRLDRTRLLRDRQVRLLAINGGEATAVLTQTELSQALGGAPVTLTPGHLVITLRGTPVAATVSMVNDQLQLQPPGLPLVTLQIPTNGLLPCTGSVAIGRGELALSCQVDRVPPALLPATAVPVNP
jgi:hypothetical protein